MANLNTLANFTNAAQALNNLILVTPQTSVGYQPQNPYLQDGQTSQLAPPSTILFDYEGENTATLEADITDHYIEDNTTVQDQIALRPVLVTVHGFVGELNDVVPPALQTLKNAASKLTVIGGYAPSLSVTAQLVYAQAAQLYALAQTTKNAAVGAWSTINKTGGGTNATQTKQQIVYTQFEGYFQSRTLFTVQTPWTIYKDMAIKTLRAIQDPDTRMITDFELTFKRLRFTSSLLLSQQQSQFDQDGRAKSQSGLNVNLGNSPLGASVPWTNTVNDLGAVG